MHVEVKCKTYSIIHAMNLQNLNFSFKASLVKASSFFPPIAAALFPILIPIGHIFVLWYFWQAYARLVSTW